MSRTPQRESRVHTRSELRGFDSEMLDLVMEAQTLGWTGRVSARGHMIMRAPDGETTMSIPRAALHGRSDKNARADFERWKKNRPGTSFGIQPGSEALTPEASMEQVVGPRSDIGEVLKNDRAFMKRLGRYVAENLLNESDDGNDSGVFRLVIDEERPDEWAVLDLREFDVAAHSRMIGEADAYHLVFGPDRETPEKETDVSAPTLDREEAAVTTEPVSVPEPEPGESLTPPADAENTDVLKTCEECGGTYRSWGQHTKVHVSPKPCPLCSAPIKYMQTHLARVHHTTMEVAKAQQLAESSLATDNIQESVDCLLTVLGSVEQLRVQNARLLERIEELEVERTVLTEERDEAVARIEKMKAALA